MSKRTRVSQEQLLKTSRIAQLSQVVVLMALAGAACSPSVPENLVDIYPESVSATTSPVAATTTSPPGATSSSAAASSVPPATTSTTTVAPTSTLADSPSGLNAGSWTVDGETRDLSGEGFAATVTVPIFSADVDSALLARINTRVDGQVESQIGSTLALWRSIEAQGSRDISGSTLRLEFDVAQLSESFVSLRFFSDERVGGSGGAKRQATTLMMDLTSGAAIGLDDLLVDGDSRATLLSQVRAGLLEDYFGDDADAFSLWTGNLTPGDLDQVALSPVGLEVWFDELEVGPPDLGMPVVAIPYANLVGILDLTGSVVGTGA